MIRIIQLLVLAFLIFLVVTEGVPWIREWVEGITADDFDGRELPESGEAALCVRLAHDASAFANEQAVAASQPPDRGRWVGSLERIERRIYEAERVCGCAGDACAVARDALAEISALVGEVDRLIGGDPRLAGELARRQEGINALLEQARVLAR